MNKQGENSIEWTDYTWNVIAGCLHKCWFSLNGHTAKCYAWAKVETMPWLDPFYPEGFVHHYYHPKRLNQPYKVKTPSKIFLDSMSDLMGWWVPATQIEQVLNTVQNCDWHQFQLLTKNAPRLLTIHFPKNLWLGVSSPPSQMYGKELSLSQQEKFLHRALRVLSEIRAKEPERITWMSFEPVLFDMAEIVQRYPNALKWGVIGAMSDGNEKYQPEQEHIKKLLRVLDQFDVPVFFKGNLEWQEWRENYPK